MKLFLATNNAHKVEEIRAILQRSAPHLELDSAAALGGMPEVEETAADFRGNARLKARALAKHLPPDGWVVADDSGIEVDALEGAPGVRSARYAGPAASDTENVAKLLKALEGVPVSRRSARFRCLLCLIDAGGRESFFDGVLEGRIASQPAGSEGFGYDPIFVPVGHDRTLAELGPVVKDRLSHRARALAALVAWAHHDASGREP